MDPDGLLLYHTNLVQLLAYCTEGKNVYTEIKCHSLLPLDDIVKVVIHPDCIPEVTTVSPDDTFFVWHILVCCTLLYKSLMHTYIQTCIDV